MTITYLVKTSNSKFDIKSLHVRSMVVFNAIVSRPDDMGCTLFNSSLNIFHGTRVLERKEKRYIKYHSYNTIFGFVYT